MNWGRLDDPAWWWTYALDGVVGGVIGGLVTGLAVWLTLRHERRLAAETAARDVEMADLAAARTQALQYQSALWRLVGAKSADLEGHLIAFREAQFMLMSVSMKRWPGFAARVNADGDDIQAELNRKHSEPGDTNHLGSVAAKAVTAAATWVVEPQKFEAAVTTPPTGHRRGRRS